MPLLLRARLPCAAAIPIAAILVAIAAIPQLKKLLLLVSFFQSEFPDSTSERIQLTKDRTFRSRAFLAQYTTAHSPPLAAW